MRLPSVTEHWADKPTPCFASLAFFLTPMPQLQSSEASKKKLLFLCSFQSWWCHSTVRLQQWLSFSAVLYFCGTLAPNWYLFSLPSLPAFHPVCPLLTPQLLFHNNQQYKYVNSARSWLDSAFLGEFGFCVVLLSTTSSHVDMQQPKKTIILTAKDKPHTSTCTGQCSLVEEEKTL